MGVSTRPEGLLLRLFYHHHRKALSLPLPLLYPTGLFYLAFVFNSTARGGGGPNDIRN